MNSRSSEPIPRKELTENWHHRQEVYSTGENKPKASRQKKNPQLSLSDSACISALEVGGGERDEECLLL
jgi:hypothetical protein